MSTLLGQFVTHTAQSFVVGSGHSLIRSIPLEEGHPSWLPIKQALAAVPSSALTTSVISPYLSALTPEARETFSSFLLAVLLYLQASDGQGADGAYGDFQRLVQVYMDANRLYATSSDSTYAYPFLNPLILNLARSLVRRSSRAAFLSHHPPRSPRSPRSIRDLTRQTIERSMQVAASSTSDTDRTEGIEREYVIGDNLWPLANILWRIYAERKFHTQATELQKTLSTLLPHEEKRLFSRSRYIRQTDVCQSYYWRGRLGVVLLDMRGAKYWLDKAWGVCPDGAWQQRRAVLIRLIPVNLLLGRLPSLSLIQQYNLSQFVPLIQAFRSGNVPCWRRELEINREWYRRRSTWLILFERGEILVLRNLLRQCLKLYYATNPSAPKNRCPTWVFLAAANRAFEGTGEAEDGTFTMEDIVCIVASLIDQSLILGHLSYSSQQLVMKPSADGMGGFPRVSQVIPRRVEAIA